MLVVIKPVSDDEDHRARATGRGGDPLFQTLHALEPALRRFIAARVRSLADVDDVLQDIAARLAARDPRAVVDNKTAFVFSIAANLLRDRKRRGHVRRDSGHVMLDDVELADPAALQDEVVDARLRLRRLSAALDRMPGEQSMVFVRHRIQGRTLSQVAEESGMSVAQVRRLLERAMTRLARKVWGD